jgi:tetratricopeptide (TPR) repeat protein
MSKNRLLVVAITLTLGASVALACGPYFPWQLLDNRSETLTATPSNSFAYEVSHLVPAPKDGLQAVEFNEFQQSEAFRSFVDADRAGLSPEQSDALTSMRSAETDEDAFAKGAILPVAQRLYTAGAVDFGKKDDSTALERFQAVLDLPPDDAQARAAWAAFMIGRTQARAGDTEKAAEAFALTRALALKGAPDPLGLAVASYGEEARSHLDDARDLLDDNGALHADPEAIATYGREIAAAAALYAEQAVRGSDSGVQSLRIIAEHVLDDADRITATVADPLVQRLLVAYVLSHDNNAPQQTAQPDPNAPTTAAPPDPVFITLVESIEKSRLDQLVAGDRLAALAYRIGRYDLAVTLAQKTASPLASWVKAKLALRNGDLAGAAGFYAEAAGSFPATDAPPSLEDASATLLTGESGVVALARSEYMEALDKLYPVASTYWGDVVHVAERVLTVDELKTFVDAKVPQPAPAPVTTDAGDSVTASTTTTPAGQLRDLLARRLARAGRFEEALAYYQDSTVHDQAAQYAKELAETKTGKTRVDRARAFFAAASLARHAGMETMGTEATPDYFSSDGAFDFGIGQQKLQGAFVTDDERKRFVASAAIPDQRYHYRYIAVDEVAQSADLLPPRSQAFAAVLCTATGWMMGTPGADEQVHNLYTRYVQEGPYVPWAANFGRDCPVPDFDDAVRTHYWRDTRNFLSHYRWPVGGGGLVVVGLIAAGWFMRRRLSLTT